MKLSRHPQNPQSDWDWWDSRTCGLNSYQIVALSDRRQPSLDPHSPQPVGHANKLHIFMLSVRFLWRSVTNTLGKGGVSTGLEYLVEQKAAWWSHLLLLSIRCDGLFWLKSMKIIQLHRCIIGKGSQFSTFFSCWSHTWTSCRTWRVIVP